MTSDGVDTRVNRVGTPGITITDDIGSLGKDKGQREVRTLDGFVGSDRYGVHNPSVINLVRGVAERVLYTSSEGGLERPVQPDPEVFELLRPLRSRVLRNTRSTTVVPVEEYPQLYHDSRKRATYARAVASLETKALGRNDAIVNTFVKAEKVNFTAKPDPAPRVIQPRSARYNVHVGRYLKPFEKNMYAGFAETYGYNVICKGLNAATTATQLRQNWEKYSSPVAIGLDASRFDQHVSRAALEYEHGFYNGIFQSRELRELLTWQLRNRGRGYCNGKKVTYTVDGCRMSGDINTSLGNCIIMSSIVLAYFEEHGVDARLSNNGDDCVVICERSQLPKMESIDAWFRRFGFKLTREAPVFDFERIQFCQTQPVLTSSGWRMVRNPFTATSKDAVSLLSWATEDEFNRWRGAISSCGLSLTRGVPFWEAYYTNIGGECDERAFERVADSGLGYMGVGMDTSGDVITPEARYSFWLAFGLDPDMQIALESVQRDIRFSERCPLTFGDVTPYSELLRR